MSRSGGRAGAGSPHEPLTGHGRAGQEGVAASQRSGTKSSLCSDELVGDGLDGYGPAYVRGGGPGRAWTHIFNTSAPVGQTVAVTSEPVVATAAVISGTPNGAMPRGYGPSLELLGRASFYDRAGAMKDMIQNHLMEAMALLLMEQPADRLPAGALLRRRARVDPNRNTETYASLTVGLNSPRWDGVPFTLRSGKALETTAAEIGSCAAGIAVAPSPPWIGRIEPRARCPVIVRIA